MVFFLFGFVLAVHSKKIIAFHLQQSKLLIYLGWEIAKDTIHD